METVRRANFSKEFFYRGKERYAVVVGGESGVKGRNF